MYMGYSSCLGFHKIAFPLTVIRLVFYITNVEHTCSIDLMQKHAQTETTKYAFVIRRYRGMIFKNMRF